MGPDIEAIVYLYASCDRGFFYPRVRAGDWTAFRDRFTGEILSPSSEQLRDFADLTLANEVDVATTGNVSGTLPEWFVSLIHEFDPLARRKAAESCGQLISAA